jgi:ribonuclease BN (tRNA processing enzyme)
MLSVTILGSGTSVPWRGRNAPGLVLRIETDERNLLVLVDPSAGSIHRMADYGYSLADLSHVLFTHYHPDHTGDLVPILFALKNPRFAAVGSDHPVQFVGPPGLIDLCKGLDLAYGHWIHHPTRVEFREINWRENQGFFALGPVETTCFPVDHTDNSIAYRFEPRSGSVLTYTGDTGYCESAIEAGREAGLLIIECSFPEGQKRKGHLTPSEVGRIAAAANAQRIVMTHLYPECRGQNLMEPCREYFRGEILIAEDGLTLHL